MANDEQIAQIIRGPAENNVSASEDFIARGVHGVGSGSYDMLGTLAQLQGFDESAQRNRALAQSFQTPAPGDILPTNPDLDNTLAAGLATGIGRALPSVALAETGPLGFAAVMGLGAAETSEGVHARQQAYDEAIAAGETPAEPVRPSMGYEQLKSGATNALLMGTGKALAPFTNPALAALPRVVRPVAGVAAHTGANIVGDVAARIGFNALEGKDLTPFSTPAEFGQALGGAFAFGAPGGIHQANAIPNWIRNRDLNRARQMEIDAVKKSMEAQTVEPNKPPPDNIEVKPATETETGVAVSPAKEAPALTPTTAQPIEQQLLPNSATAVAQTSTKEPQVVVTPKVEPTKTEEKPGPPTAKYYKPGQGLNIHEQQLLAQFQNRAGKLGEAGLVGNETARMEELLAKQGAGTAPPEGIVPTTLEPADRIKAIDEEMAKIEEQAGVSTEDGSLIITDPQTQTVYDALASERMKLALGIEPTKAGAGQPVSGQERPKAENAPPPFTSETEPVAPVEFPETQKAPKVTQADVTEKVAEPTKETVIPEDLTKLTDDELIDADSFARQSNDQDALARIDAESGRRAELAGQQGDQDVSEVRTGTERLPGDQRPVDAEVPAGPGGGVRGDEAVTGERGQEPVPGLTPEESTELRTIEAEETALWKKPGRLTDAEDRRIQEIQNRRDELESKIPKGPAPAGAKIYDPKALANPTVDEATLTRANDHVNNRLIPRAVKVMESIFGGKVNVILEPRSNHNFGVSINADGTLNLHVDPNAGAWFRHYRKANDFKTSAFARKILGEEIIHAAQLKGITKIWEKMDPQTRGDADVFAGKFIKNVLDGMNKEVDRLRSIGQDAQADKLAAVIEASSDLYSLARGTVGGDNLLKGWQQNPVHGVNRLLELQRQLHQYASSGSITETFLNRVIVPIGEWVKGAFESLKDGLKLAEKGAYGPEFDELYRNTKRQLLGQDISLKEALPQRTLDALNGLNLKYNGVQGGVGKIRAFNLFTSTEPGKETTFAARLGSSPEQVAAARDRALLPYNERGPGGPELPEDNGLGQGIPDGTKPEEVPSTSKSGAAGGAGKRSGKVGGSVDQTGDVSGGVRGGNDTSAVGSAGGGATETNPARATNVKVSDNAIGQPAQSEKPKTAFERIGDFLKQNKYVARAIHRFSPSIMDARDNYTRIIDGQDAVSARAAGKARDTLIRALPKKEDQDAANIVLASGGGRIGEAPSEAERLNLDSMTKHRDDLLDQFERAKEPEEQKALKQQIDDLSEGIARFDADPQTVEGVTKKIQDQINKGKLALENPEIPEDRKADIRKWMPVFERAAESVERLSPASKLAKREYDDAYMIRHPLDPTGRYYQDYAGRIYEYNESRGNSPAPPASLIGGSYGGTKFNKSRFYPTVMDAMIGHSVEGGGWEGESPKSLNLPDLVANHVKSSNDFVGGEAVKERLQTEQYPDTNEPVILPDLKPGQKPPANYVKVAGPRGEDVWVYHPVADLFKSVWAPDAIKNTDIGKGLTKAAGVLKHGTVAYDVFHPSRLIQIGAFEALADGKFRESANRIGEYIKNVVKPGVLTGEHGQMGKFLSLFNVDARDIDRYVKDGTITQETADYLRGEGKTDLKQMTEGGLRPQLFTDNLWKDAEPFLRKVADKIGLGTGKLIDAQTQLNKATFDRLAPAMMAAVFKWRRAALEKSHPELTQVQLSRRAATETNERFGNLGKSGPIKSATAQSFANIISLAPMWQISQAAAEARQFGQLGRAAVEAAWGKTMPNGQRQRVFRLGNSAKFLATTAATIFALNQAVNMATRGHPTWQNPEDDHKFDAWIPGGKNGFFYSPTTLVAEYSHHFKNYRQFESPIGAVAHIATNKLSPMGQAAKIALTQKNYKGEKLSTLGTIGEVAKSLTPIPISVGSAAQPLNPLASPSKSGQLGLNVARTFGVGLDRAPDAVAIGYQKFAPYRTKDKPDTGPSVYRDLKTLVQNEASPADIKKEVERLKTKEGKKIEDIRQSFNFKNLSGSLANDLKAIKEKPELSKIRAAAIAQKKAEADALRKALNTK